MQVRRNQLRPPVVRAVGRGASSLNSTILLWFVMTPLHPPPPPPQRNTKEDIDYMFGVIHKQLVLRCLEENHHGTWSSGHLSRIIMCAMVLRRERRRKEDETRKDGGRE